MRNVLGVLLLCLISSHGVTAAAGASFYRIYEDVRYTTGFTSIEQTSDGGYIGIGTAYHSTTNYAVALKLDAAGRVVWQNNYVVSGQLSQGSSIRETSSGYLALVALGPFGGAQTLMVMSLDPVGALLWQNTYPSSNSADFLPYSIEPTSDGGILVSALNYSSAYSLWALKLDSTGAIVWQKSFGTYAGLGSIRAAADGGAIVAGGPPSGSAYAGRVLKLDAAGNPDWDRSYAFPFEAFFTSARPTPDGGYIVSGYYIIVGTNSRALLIQLDALGNVTSTFAYASSSCPEEHAFDAQNMAGGGYLVYFGYCNGTYNGVARIDSTGAIVWQRNPFDSAASVLLSEAAFSPTRDGGYVAAGSVFGSGLSSQLLVVKSDAAGGLPACAQNGSPNLRSIAPPSLVVTSVPGPTMNISTNPQPIAVTAAPAEFTTKSACAP